MVKKSANLKKSLFYPKLLKKKKNVQLNTEKSRLFLNIRTMHFDQSSQVQPNHERKKILEKSEISLFHIIIFLLVFQY